MIHIVLVLYSTDEGHTNVIYCDDVHVLSLSLSQNLMP